MRKTTIQTLASLVLGLSFVSSSSAAFIQPSSITASSTSINTPSVLISDATGNGELAYVPPAPNGGGGGTSWYTSVNGNTGVNLNFEIATSGPLELLDKLHLWDYYSHSPSDWNLKLYSGTGGTGTELLDLDFSFTPGPGSMGTLHTIEFADQAGVLSGSLTTLNSSSNGGVGLSELGFSTFTFVPPVPEPSSLMLLGLGALGLMRHTHRRRRKA